MKGKVWEKDKGKGKEKEKDNEKDKETDKFKEKEGHGKKHSPPLVIDNRQGSQCMRKVE